MNTFGKPAAPAFCKVDLPAGSDSLSAFDVSATDMLVGAGWDSKVRNLWTEKQCKLAICPG